MFGYVFQQLQKRIWLTDGCKEKKYQIGCWAVTVVRKHSLNTQACHVAHITKCRDPQFVIEGIHGKCHSKPSALGQARQTFPPWWENRDHRGIEPALAVH